MTETDAAWLAGFFEGEAWFGTHEYTETRNGISYGPYVRTKLQVRQVDKDLVDAVEAITGCGRRSVQHPKQEGWADQYEWRTTHKPDIVRIVTSILPYMRGQRRIDEATRLLTAAQAPRKIDRRTLDSE